MAAVGLSAATLLAEAPAGATDPFWLYQGDTGNRLPLHGFYLAGQAWGGAQQLPRFNSTISTCGVLGVLGTPATSMPHIRPDVTGVQPGGAVGYVLRDGSLPAWLGQRVRVEFSGHAILMSSTKHNRIDWPVGGATIHSIDGSIRFINSPSIRPARETLRTDHDGFALRLKLASDFALTPSFTLSPAIGVIGGRAVTTFNYGVEIDFIAIPGAASQLAIHERVTTREIGVEFGATGTWQFAQSWGLHAGASVAPVWLNSRLRGDDCFVAGLALGSHPCIPPSPNNPNPVIRSGTITDRRSSIDLRVGGALGVSADFGFGVVTLAGTVRYDSRLPGVRNPQLTALSGAPIGPARIRFEDGLAYGGMLRVAVPLRWWGL
jgi:hypothetical protein